MLFRYIIFLFIAVILYCLGSAMKHLLCDKGGSKNTVKALTWRISLSFGLFVLIFIAYALGWIHPHSV